MRDNASLAVHNAIFDAWRLSYKRQDLLAEGFGGFLRQENYVGAPLGLTDIYVAAKREVDDLTPTELLQILDKYTRWKGDFLAPYGRGAFTYRLMSSSGGVNYVIRFGDHPNNGIMHCYGPDDVPADVAAFEGFLYGTEIEEIDMGALAGGIPKEAFARAVEVALRAAFEEDEDEQEEPLSFQRIAYEVFESLNESGNAEDRPHGFDSLVQAQVSTWSRRLCQVNFHSETVGILVFDAVQLPSGGCYITEWNDNEEIYVVGELTEYGPEGAYTVLKEHLTPWLEPKGEEEEEDEGLDWLPKKGRHDFVINGQLIKGDETYPIHEDSFWRDLLGFGAMSTSLPKPGLEGKLAKYVGR